MSATTVRFVAHVPADVRDRAVQGVVRDQTGEERALPHAAALVLETDPALPELGATIRGHAATGEVVTDTWYVTDDEARRCATQTYDGRLGPWRPVPAGADPMAIAARDAEGRDEDSEH